jgi:hypothetical protein
LVNFDFFTRVLENYGFVPLTDNEAQRMGFPQAIGEFNSLFDIMKEEIDSGKINKTDVGKALNMSNEEKTISFLNNYYIFKKIRNPNAKEITDRILNITAEQTKLDDIQTDELQQEIKPTKKRTVKKYKKKLKLPK